MSRDETFEVNVIFRGLFLAHHNENGLAVLLPDGRNPARIHQAATEGSPLRQLGPFREHHGVLEFPLAAWQNRSLALPDLMEVHKPTKEPVALCLLGQGGNGREVTDRIQFSTLRGSDRELPASLRSPNGAYLTPSNASRVRILSVDPANGMDQLPPFSGAPKSDAWLDSVAFAQFDVGEVTTERRSTERGNDLLFILPRISQLNLGLQPPPTASSRAINLDLRVRFAVRSTDTLVVEVIKHPRIEASPAENFAFLPSLSSARTLHTFFLKPPGDSKTVDLWIKNRELDQVILDSDLLPDPFPACRGGVLRDSDHGLMLLLADDPAQVTMPFVASGEMASAGCACGGCGGG